MSNNSVISSKLIMNILNGLSIEAALVYPSKLFLYLHPTGKLPFLMPFFCICFLKHGSGESNGQQFLRRRRERADGEHRERVIWSSESSPWRCTLNPKRASSYMRRVWLPNTLCSFLNDFVDIFVSFRTSGSNTMIFLQQKPSASKTENDVAEAVQITWQTLFWFWQNEGKVKQQCIGSDINDYTFWQNQIFMDRQR